MNFSDLVALPDRSQYNVGLSSPNNARMLELLGNPRDNYTGECLPVTNKTLSKKISTQKVGKVSITGLTVAIDSLKSIFARVSMEVPDLIPHVSTAGMLCCRRVKLPTGLGKNLSNHSWGTAIDLKFDGQLDPRDDGRAQRGLLNPVDLLQCRRLVLGSGLSDRRLDALRSVSPAADTMAERRSHIDHSPALRISRGRL